MTFGKRLESGEGVHEELGVWGKFLLNVKSLMLSLAGRLIISKETEVLEQKAGSGGGWERRTVGRGRKKMANGVF